VLGLIRDHYQAVFFGTGGIATAWEIAYMLPNMLRNLLAEGVLSQSFIPVYSDALKKSEWEAKRVAGIIIAFLALFLIALVISGIFLFQYFIPIYTGKSGAEAAFIIDLSQIMFVFIMTTSLTAIFAGISNTHRYFFIPSLSPIILNLIFIASFWFLMVWDMGGEGNARFLAWGVVAGGVVQLAFQAWHVYRIDRFPEPALRLRDPALNQIFSMMAPAVLGASLFQLNQLIDIALASYFISDEEGAIPALRYAHRLIQLPTGIIGVALSTAILPFLVGSIRSGNGDQNSRELADALNFSAFLTVPAGIGLYLLGPEIINLIYSGGAWTPDSTRATWLALQFYCLGVPLYSANKILTSTHYAYKDTRTPIRILILTVIVNFTLNLILIHSMRQGALALSTSLAALLNGGLLLYTARTKLGGFEWGRMRVSLMRQIPLWILLSLYLISLKSLFDGPIRGVGSSLAALMNSEVIVRYEALSFVGFGISGGLLLYLTSARLLRIREMETLLGFTKRKNRNILDK
jgi:putative peptidoglycan lipid II flippase